MKIKILPLLFLSMIVLSCDKTSDPVSSEREIFITKFDVEGFHKTYLPNFTLVRKRGRWREGREFLYEETGNEDNNFLIRVGIHSSKTKAQEIAEEFNSWCMIFPQEDTTGTLGIGERSWWMPDVVSPDTIGYIFIRSNLFILTDSHTYQDLLDLTRAIDADIINDAEYIEKSESLELPQILSVTTTKSILHEGESAQITVTASDPNNEPLEYVFDAGLFRGDNPENVFTMIASRNYVSEPFIGSHIYKFIVYNESNVISEEAELEIMISE